MEIVINPTAVKVWRNANTLQIGLAEKHVVLENLQARHEKFISALYSGLTPSQVKSYARHLGLRIAETQTLITALEPVLLRQTQRTRLTRADGHTHESEIKPREIGEVASLPEESPSYQNALGEMNQASFKLSARGESVWSLRQDRAVFVGALDKTGQFIAHGLAEAGIGAVVSGDLTQRRLEQLRTSLACMPAAPQLVTLNQLSAKQIARIDVAILMGQQLIESQKFAAWMNRSTPTIAAVQASAAEALQAQVSHVIMAGQTPCWVCLEFSRRKANPAWPDMASQIVGREQRFDSASAALSLAGQVVEKTLNQIDRANGFKVRADEPKWSFSDECGCRLATNLSPATRVD